MFHFLPAGSPEYHWANERARRINTARRELIALGGELPLEFGTAGNLRVALDAETVRKRLERELAVGAF